MINLHERMLPTSAGVEPATSWSSVGRRIQLSHRGRQDFLVFLPYMGITAILFNDAEPYEQSVNNPSTEGPMWNPVKIGQVGLEKKTFTDFKVLYLYIAQEQGQITPRGQNFDPNKNILLL